MTIQYLKFAAINLSMSYFGSFCTRKERKGMKIKWQERLQKRIEQREERRRMEAASRWDRKEKLIRTDAERAECLLRGLRGDVENFYSQVKLRGGLRQEKSYEYQGRDILGPGLFYDDAAQRPVAGTDRYEADEFLSKTGISPRNFLSRGHCKGMAYRLKELAKYMEASPSLLPGYKDLMADLKRTGIYGELVRLDKNLQDLPLCD